MSEVRASWDDTWVDVARVVAKRSRCIRDQVGAVIVDHRNRIVSTGYNGPPSNFPAMPTLARNDQGTFTNPVRDCDMFCPRAMHGPSEETIFSYIDCPSLHAEANAIAVADRSTFEGGTLYVSSGICQPCAKQISNSGIARVVIARSGTNDYRDVDRSYAFLRLCEIRVDIYARVL